MKTNNNNDNKYKIENGELIAGYKGEVFCYFDRKEYDLTDYPDLYEKIKTICIEYFSKQKK